MSGVFNLDREISLEHMIDPLGKKWVIHGAKGSALVHARPDPDRVDAQIPKEFAGQWTSPTVLKTKIEMWLERQWNLAEEAQRKSGLKQARVEHQEKVEKKTHEEALDELPEEIKEFLADADMSAAPVEEGVEQNTLDATEQNAGAED